MVAMRTAPPPQPPRRCPAALPQPPAPPARACPPAPLQPGCQDEELGNPPSRAARAGGARAGLPAAPSRALPHHPCQDVTRRVPPRLLPLACWLLLSSPFPHKQHHFCWATPCCVSTPLHSLALRWQSLYNETPESRVHRHARDARKQRLRDYRIKAGLFFWGEVGGGTSAGFKPTGMSVMSGCRCNQAAGGSQSGSGRRGAPMRGGRSRHKRSRHKEG